MEKGIHLIGNGQGKPKLRLTHRYDAKPIKCAPTSHSSVLERDSQRLYHLWKVRPDVHDHPSGSARGYGKTVPRVRQTRAWHRLLELCVYDSTPDHIVLCTCLYAGGSYLRSLTFFFLRSRRRPPTVGGLVLNYVLVFNIVKVIVETRVYSPPTPGCPKTSRVDDWSHEDPGVSFTGDL